MAETNGTGRWADLYWEELFEILGTLPRRPGVGVEGVCALPPPVSDIAWADGIWEDVNAELGTMLDEAEEEELDPQQARLMAKIIERRTAEYAYLPSGEQIERVVGQQIAPVPRDIVATTTAGEFLGFLRAIHEFLTDAAARGKRVVVSL